VSPAILWSSKVQSDSRRINFKARDSPEFGALCPFELTNRPLVSICDPGTSSVADCESVFMLCYSAIDTWIPVLLCVTINISLQEEMHMIKTVWKW
jgi:hypothetical protein